jgi:hypothetical protein
MIMILLHPPTMHVVENVRRKEEKCSWWELTFSDVDKKYQSEYFADYSAVGGVDEDDDDDDDSTVASACDDCSVVSRISMASSIGRSRHSLDGKKKSSKDGKKKKPSKDKDEKKKKPSKDKDEKKKIKKSRSMTKKSRNQSDQLSNLSTHSAPATLFEEPSSLLSGVPQPPPPPPANEINTPPASRLSFLNKQRSWRVGKAIGGKYIGRKETSKRNDDSDDRRDLVKSSLYTCIEDDEDDYLSSLFSKTAKA